MTASAPEGSAGDRSAGDAPAGDGSVGDGAARDVPAGDASAGSGAAGAHRRDVRLPDRPGGSTALTGVLGVPDGPGPWPGIVMVHEAFGVTDVMRRQVDRMTRAGYLVLMPDLFTEGGPRRCLVSTFRALSAGEGRAFVDIETARTELAGRADCTGSVGVVGFCMGGGFALLAARRGFAVSSVNYGRLPDDLDASLIGACPIIGSYGGNDRSLRGAAGRLDEALDRVGVPHDVHEYPGAGHSFLNESDDGPRALRWVGRRVLGVGPEPASAAAAWTRIDAFLAEHLSPSANSAGSVS